jgi:hypothetical protein
MFTEQIPENHTHRVKLCSHSMQSKASLERCLLRFLSKDGNPVEIFMPALVLLVSWLIDVDWFLY